jgi:(p)ppGpp synthase/HD superfamily hydrolase
MYIDVAKKIATKAHKGQQRKDDKEYITHLNSVVNQFGEDSDAIVVGWLHDVLEDSSYTSADLINDGIPEDLVNEFERLTKKREQTYRQYIDVVKTSALAIKVKKVDLIANLSDNPSNKQVIKLAKALIQLCSK